MRRCLAATLVFLVLAVVGQSAQPSTDIQPKGPGEFPKRLTGVWKVSLCCSQNHSWIRFEDTSNREVHTLGRFQKGAGGDRNHATVGWWVPPVPAAGLMWDQDLRFEPALLTKGRYILLSVMVRDPAVYRGLGDGVGYGPVTNNCATYARDAWHHYSGEWYDLTGIHLPGDLAVAAAHRHSEIPLALRLNLSSPD